MLNATIGRLLLACLCLLGISRSFAAEEAAEKAKPELLATIKMKPIKSVSDEVVSLARTVQPGMGTEMMLMALAPYGYPNYDGISPEAPVNLVLIDDMEAEQPYLVYAKIDESSPVLQNLQNLKVPYGKHGEWTVFGGYLELVDSLDDIEGFQAMLKEQPEHDIELQIMPDALERHREDLKIAFLLATGAPMGGNPPEGLKRAIKLIDIFVDRMTAYDQLRIGFDIEKDALVLSGNMDAKADTPEAELLSATVEPRDLPLVDYLPGDAYMLIKGQYNMQAYAKYMDFLVAEIEEVFDADTTAILKQFAEIMHVQAESSDGSFAAAVNLKNNRANVLSVTGAQMTEAAMQEMLAKTYEGENSLIHRFMQLLYLDMFGVTFEFKLENEHERYRDHAIARQHIVTTIKQDEEEDPALALLGETEIKMEIQEQYSAVVEGNYLVATLLDDLKALMDRVLDKQAHPSSFSTRFGKRSEALASMRIDAVAMVYQSLVNSELGLEAESLEDFKQQAELDLPPIMLEAWTREGRFLAEFRLPIETMAGFSRMATLGKEQAGPGTKRAPETSDSKTE